jgi:hypothetical protein
MLLWRGAIGSALGGLAFAHGGRALASALGAALSIVALLTSRPRSARSAEPSAFSGAR